MSINNYQVQPASITKFEITNTKSGKSVNATQLIAQFSYFESIVKPAVTLNIIVVESGNSVDKNGKSVSLLDGLPLRGGEKVEIEFTDKNNPPNKISLSNLYINGIGNIIQDGQKTLYNLHICSNEYLINESIFVSKVYDGKISETVTKILKDELKVSNVFVDETINEEKVYGLQSHPLELCTTLAKRSIPNLPNAKGFTAGYFFYQTADGYNFKSIDGMFDTSGKTVKKFIFNKTPEYPVGYDGKILSFTPDRTIDVKTQLKNGAYGIKNVFFNPDSLEIENKELGIKDQDKKAIPSGKEYTFLPDELLKATQIAYGVYDVKQSITGKDVDEQLDKMEKDPKKLNLDIPNLFAQGKMRYNQLFTQKFNITIPGDISLRAGQIIKCDFPLTSTEENKTIDESISGIYMIESLRHSLSPEQTVTYLTLVRDSFGRIA
jgi:hypothetical protein